MPLRDTAGTLHTIEFIAGDGTKRYLAGGAKAGHFCTIGGPLGASGAFLICEGWATGASLHEATGLPVVAAMDAGNLGPVAEQLRQSYPDAAITIVADNDDKPGRDINPGVNAATKAAVAIDARLAIPPVPGDANDLAILQGADAVATMVAGAAFVPPPAPTYPEPVLTPEAARAELAQALQAFMAEVPTYWRAAEEAETAAEASPATDPLDFNAAADRRATAARPAGGCRSWQVQLGAHSDCRRCWRSGALGARKVVYAVPRHDLGQEQVEAFEALGVRAMLWKGRTAPDPTPDNPERLMCLDPEATFDALEVEQPVEQSCCKVRRDGELHLCPHFHACGYQRQKAAAQAAQVIVCAHDSLFHMKPDAVGSVGLLVIDEAFWQSGLRGLDGKAVLTQDGLEPGKASVTCYKAEGPHRCGRDRRSDRGAPQALEGAPGHRTGPAQPRAAAERRPDRRGMPKCRAPRAPAHARPGAAARHGACRAPPAHREGAPAVWPALGASGPLRDAVADPRRGAGGRARRRGGSARQRAHRERLGSRAEAALARAATQRLGRRGSGAASRRHAARGAGPALPAVSRGPGAGRFHNAACPGATGARQPDHRQGADAGHAARPSATERPLRIICVTFMAYVRLRARELRRSGPGPDLLVIGQKAAIDALRAAGLPSRVDAVHFNGLSGLDRWGGIAGLIVLGRTLPAPITVEALCAALTGQMPVAAADGPGWWYGTEVRRIRIAGGRTHAVPGEVHADPTAEAIRWSICEARADPGHGARPRREPRGREPAAD